MSNGDVLPLETFVEVKFTGRIVGHSRFSEGPDSYYVEHERKGRMVKEWVVMDRVTAVPSVPVNGGSD